MKQSLLLITALLLMLGCNSNKSNNKSFVDKAIELHAKIITIDSHTDTPLMLMQDGFSIDRVETNRRAKVTLDYMQKGGLDAAFFAVFIGQGDRNEEKYNEVHQTALQIFDSVYAAIGRYPQKAEIALSPKDAKRLKDLQKRAIFIGVENGYPIGTDLSRLDQYYNLGARYLTLCHTQNNDICDSSTDRNGPEHNGLSSFGEKVVKKLNKLGMMVDVSHISDSAFFQTLEVSETPIIASHSNARAICDNPRNLTDE
ncbi:MAG TPA: membrane dipeptidase, partial [Tenuifilaceae bacterium]|nr:membrane dipeptidase [Tenuifilaceae bacterium]